MRSVELFQHYKCNVEDVAMQLGEHRARCEVSSPVFSAKLLSVATEIVGCRVAVSGSILSTALGIQVEVANGEATLWGLACFGVVLDFKDGKDFGTVLGSGATELWRGCSQRLLGWRSGPEGFHVRRVRPCSELSEGDVRKCCLTR